MRRRVRISSAIFAATLAFVVGTSTAHAILNKTQYSCQTAIAKEGVKFVQGQLKLRQKCIADNLAAGGLAICPVVDPTALQNLRAKLDSGLAKKCTFPINTPGNLAVIGFPGPCPDANTLDNFTLADLQACIRTSHEDLVTGVCGGGSNAGETCSVVNDCPDSGPGTYCRGLLTLEYDPTLGPGPLTGTSATCQKELVKSSTKFVLSALKTIQKCRNNILNCKVIDLNTGATECKLNGVQPANCATDLGPDLAADNCDGGTNDGAICTVASECPGGTCVAKTKFANQKTIDALAKAKTKAEAAIAGKCLDADAVALKACDPDQLTAAAAATCETTTHQALADNPDPTDVFDLLDFEYATPGVCGDDRKNRVAEECDGVDDADCPGLCGTPNGFFGCLCLDIPRQRVVEHSNADLDNGWTGKSHDSGIVEGGGYVSDLWDCDGPGGPDVICNVGPTCSTGLQSPCNPAPNSFVTGNSICAGLGQGVCRKTAGGANGPHCEIDFQKRCDTNAQCPGLGDRCVKTPHGIPLPLSSGGVSVCVLNIFSEDVVGTSNVLTGAGAVRLRQRSITHLGPSQNQPCPVCGGFCAGAGSGTSPGVRTLCTTDADCPGSSCVTNLVCSYGPNLDKPCRATPPFGGPSEFFGNPSVDCPPAPGANISGPGLDILFNPATTGSTSTSPTFNCTATGFGDTRCYGGGNDGKLCTGLIDCPGGTCAEQCVCPPPVGGVGLATRPNACDAACVGLPNDGQTCVDDTDCAPGFCHPGDCRVNGLDNDSTQEGLCTAGPLVGTCSTSAFKTCDEDADCQGLNCTFCEPGETCFQQNQQCFVNGTISRAGVPGSPDRISAALFCIGATGTPSVDGVAGLPGPGAITQPATTIEVGF